MEFRIGDSRAGHHFVDVNVAIRRVKERPKLKAAGVSLPNTVEGIKHSLVSQSPVSLVGVLGSDRHVTLLIGATCAIF